jgi:hypothetical protein
MPYILRYKYDRNQPQKVRGLPFATIPLAIASGRTLLAAGAGWDFNGEGGRRSARSCAP